MLILPPRLILQRLEEVRLVECANYQGTRVQEGLCLKDRRETQTAHLVRTVSQLHRSNARAQITLLSLYLRNEGQKKYQDPIISLLFNSASPRIDSTSPLIANVAISKTLPSKAPPLIVRHFTLRKLLRSSQKALRKRILSSIRIRQSRRSEWLSELPAKRTLFIPLSDQAHD